MKKCNLVKWITVLCTLICLFSLTACGESESDLAKQKERENMEAYKLQRVEEDFETYLSLIDYVDTQSYPTVAVYNNQETVAYVSQFTQYYMQYSLNVDGHGFQTALESFHLVKDTTGALKTNEDGSYQVSNIKAEVNGNQILAHADVACEKKNATVELIFSNDMFLTLEGGSLNAVSTMGDLMEKAALNTLIGMGTVFIVLILISLIIACFGFIPKLQATFAKKETEKQINTEGINNAVAQIAQQEETQEDATDDTELVAVIAAAIAAFEGSTNTEGFVVRSIRRR